MNPNPAPCFRRADSSPSRLRRGMTLIELIIALVSATLLTASLASIALIASRLLEQPMSDRRLSEQAFVTQRVEDDVRYATSVNLNSGYGITLVRPDLASGADETIVYGNPYSGSGLTRRAGAQSSQTIDATANVSLQSVDGYSAATSTAAPSRPRRVRIESTRTNAIDHEKDMTIAVPSTTDSDDWLLLFVVSESQNEPTISDSNWQSFRNLENGSLRLNVFIRQPSSSVSDALVTFSERTDAAAIVLAVDDEGSYWAVRNHTYASGNAFGSDATTWAGPVAVSDTQDQDLNLQIFATTGEPWPTDTLGLAGLVEVDRHSSETGNAGVCMVVSARTGPLSNPSLGMTIETDSNSNWLALGMALGGDTW